MVHAVGGLAMVEPGPTNKSEFVFATERLLYYAVKETMSEAVGMPCTLCKVEAGTLCVGVLVMHAVRIRKGVRVTIRKHMKGEL